MTTYVASGISSNLLNTYYMLDTVLSTSYAIFIFTPHKHPVIKLLFFIFHFTDEKAEAELSHLSKTT